MDKDADAYRTISEVAQALDIPPHVLRFWETKFPQIKPLKRGGGRRYYRRSDTDMLRMVRRLLYEEGYTIRGVQQLLRARKGTIAVEGEGQVQSGYEASPAHLIDEAAPSHAPATAEPAHTDSRIAALMAEIAACRSILDRMLDDRRPAPNAVPACPTEPPES